MARFTWSSSRILFVFLFVLIIGIVNLALFTWVDLKCAVTARRSSATVARGDGKGIVRIIHQSWKSRTSLPRRFLAWSNSWRRTCFPDWRYMLWTDEDNRNLIQNHYPWFLRFYDSYPEEIFRADAARYFYLYHYGGLYTDLDNECLTPFDHLLANRSVVLGAMEGQWEEEGENGYKFTDGYTQNSLMYSTRRHPFWLDMFAALISRADLEPASPELQTGPFVLMDMVKEYRDRNPDRRGEIKVYPGSYFNPFSWMTAGTKTEDDAPPAYCKDLNRMTDEELNRCRDYYRSRGSYVIQYHSQSWGEGKLS